ncbi:hypothetical protein EC988_001005 [Linderina pennispora]|nr:hypothetical protein EC988_001005 [Linderina pennispora]
MTSSVTAPHGTGIELTVCGPPQLDSFVVSEYLGGYTPQIKIRRALQMGRRCPELALEAYQIAYNELVHNTLDVETAKIVAKFIQDLDSSFIRDTAWEDDARRTSHDEQENLRVQIESNMKQHLMKDASQGQAALANLYERMGLSDKATASYLKARDYCTSLQDQADMSAKAAYTGASIMRWAQVSNYANKALSTSKTPNDEANIGLRLLVLQADMGESKWSDVARNVGSLNYESANTSQVVTPMDIALYGTLAGLASLSRDEIKDMLINNTQFRKFLEHLPVCLELLQLFYRSQYTSALAKLDQVMSLARIDMVLALQVDKLLSKIRVNILVLYTQPFASTRLESMAKALRFGTASELERELASLISSGRIKARIDLVNGFLISYKVEPRDLALQKVEKMYKTFSDQSELLLARVMFLEEETANTPKSSRR